MEEKATHDSNSNSNNTSHTEIETPSAQQLKSVSESKKGVFELFRCGFDLSG